MPPPMATSLDMLRSRWFWIFLERASWRNHLSLSVMWISYLITPTTSFAYVVVSNTILGGGGVTGPVLIYQIRSAILISRIWVFEQLPKEEGKFLLLHSQQTRMMWIGKYYSTVGRTGRRISSATVNSNWSGSYRYHFTLRQCLLHIVCTSNYSEETIMILNGHQWNATH